MIMTKNFFHINFLPPPLSHKFSNEEKKKLTSMQYQHTKQLICNIKSINLVRHSLLSVTEHVSQTTKSCFIPIALPLGSSCLLPFLHVHFHVVVNCFPHLSIATTPNNSLPASWVKKMCPHGYAGSLKCHRLFAITPTPQTGSQARVWFSLHPRFRSLKFMTN